MKWTAYGGNITSSKIIGPSAGPMIARIAAPAMATLMLVIVIASSVDGRTSRNGKIAFVSGNGSGSEIYLINADGTGRSRITHNSIVDDHPSWSPDGSRIAFLSLRRDGTPAIFTMNPDGSGRTVVTNLNGHYPFEYYDSLSWSPDGRQIAYNSIESSTLSGYINYDIFVVNVDGSDKKNLTPDHPHFDGYPVWSPDGSRILFSRYDFYPGCCGGSMLHTIKPSGANLAPLLNAFADGWNEDWPDWSPATDKIIYSVNEWDNINALYIANPDGTLREQFHSFYVGAHSIQPKFSPDAKKVVFTAFGGLLDQIYVKDVANDEPKLLANNARSPSWQRIGRSDQAAR